MASISRRIRLRPASKTTVNRTESASLSTLSPTTSALKEKLNEEEWELFKLAQTSRYCSSKSYRRRLEIRFLLAKLAFQLKLAILNISEVAGTFDVIQAAQRSAIPWISKRNNIKGAEYQQALFAIYKLDTRIEHNNREITHPEWLRAIDTIKRASGTISANSLLDLCILLEQMTCIGIA